MSQLRFIETILASAEDTSLVDDEALDLLGRSLLSALIRDPEAPETLKHAAARMLQKSDSAPTKANVRTDDDTRD